MGRMVSQKKDFIGRFMGELLESWGLAATVLSRPLGVIERVSREPGAYDLVILDQTMPGITGVSLARELAATLPDGLNLARWVSEPLADGSRIDEIEESYLASAPAGPG